MSKSTTSTTALSVVIVNNGALNFTIRLRRCPKDQVVAG